MSESDAAPLDPSEKQSASPAVESVESTAAKPPPATPAIAQQNGISLIRLLYTQNPFYLLSVCFVLHGTGLGLKETGSLEGWPLAGLIALYVLLMSSVCYAVVRWCKVWNDARSIFFILPLLFVELSLTFDRMLIDRPQVGAWAACGGFVFSALIIAGLLRGLKIRLAGTLPLAYYTWLATLFLYPLLLTPAFLSDARQISWGIFLFPTVTAVLMLMLLPVVRRGPEYLLNNGTPWRSPLFPWSLYAFLGMCSAFRAYALSLSFDSVPTVTQAEAMQLGSAFGACFLIPMVLSLAVLLVEGAIASRRPGVAACALLCPLIMGLMSIRAVGRGVPYDLFQNEFTNQLGSPLHATLLCCVAFYMYALYRQVKCAEAGLVATTFLLSVVGPETTYSTQLTPVQAWPFVCLAAFQFALSVRRRNSPRFVFSLILATFALQVGPFAALPSVYRVAVSYHLVVAAVLLTGRIFQDAFARLIQQAAAPLLFVASCGAALLSAGTGTDIPTWVLIAYLPCTTAALLLYGWIGRERLFLAAGSATAVLTLVVCSGHAALWIERITQWRGVWSYLYGLSSLLLAVSISAVKGGLHRRFLSFGVEAPGTSVSTLPDDFDRSL